MKSFGFGHRFMGAFCIWQVKLIYGTYNTSNLMQPITQSLLRGTQCAKLCITCTKINSFYYDIETHEKGIFRKPGKHPVTISLAQQFA